MSEFTNLSSLRLLRSVDLLSKLTILQLSQIADSLSEISFSDGQSLFDKVKENLRSDMGIDHLFFFLIFCKCRMKVRGAYISSRREQ